MCKEFDKDELKSLINEFKATVKAHSAALVKGEVLDEDDFNEETYELAIAVEEIKTEIRDYVELHKASVNNLRTEYSIIAVEIFEEME